jgi:hypothetical protein
MAEKVKKSSHIDTDTLDYYMQGASIDDPPKIFEYGKRDWKKRHDEVLNYGRVLFQYLASEETLCDAQNAASIHDAFYTGSEKPQPTGYDLSLISANLINAVINMKNSTLLNHRLEMHYVAEKNQDYDLTVAVQRLFDWQALRTHRDYFKSEVELNTIVQGSSGLLLLPKNVYDRGRKTLIPAYPEVADIRKTYFDPYEDIHDLTCLIIRDVIKGHLADQRYKSVLDKHGVKRFNRGPGFSIWSVGDYENDEYYQNPRSSRSIYTDERTRMLDQMGPDAVELVRIWKRDDRTVDAKLYKPFIDPATKQQDPDTVTEETEYAQFVAEKELMPIIMTGHTPKSGENHYNHLLVHNIDLQKMEADKKLPDTDVDDLQIANMEAHIAATEKFLDDGDQPADLIVQIPMFNGRWRFMKFINDICIEDGSTQFDYDQVPFVFFKNAIDPNTSLGLSDVAQLENLNAATNSLLNDIIINSHENAYPDKRLPRRFMNPEEFPIGETIFIDEETDADWMFQPVRPGDYPSQGFNALGALQRLIEVVSGGNATMRGDPSEVRQSGVETQAKQAAAMQRYTSTEILFGFAWERFAEITLGQLSQYMKGENIATIVGPEYQDVVPMMMDAVDPYANIKVVRVPKDMDFENQNGQQLLQLSMLLLEAGMTLPQTVLKVISSEGNAGAVGRILGKYAAEMQKPEVQAEMAELKAMQQDAESSKKSR